MKAMKILIGVALVASAGLNVWLWQQRAAQLAATETARAGVAETEALRAENETLKTQSAAKPATSEADTRELARLRNDVGQLRKQAADADAQRGQAAREAAQLRTQLADAAQKLEDKGKDAAAALNMTPEQMVQAKQRAQSLMCLSNLKQIGLAARLYAGDHGKTFPPDLATLKDQLVTPKVLFCPAAPGGGTGRTGRS